MKDYKYSLEKYNPKVGKHICPSCNHRNVFVRYIDKDTKEYVDGTIGRCDREDKCGYHKKPKEFFQEHPSYQVEQQYVYQNVKSETNHIPTYIDDETVESTLGQYGSNSFVQGLIDVFGQEEVMKVVSRYKIGTRVDRDDEVIFWQIDRNSNCRSGKVMSYDRATIKRGKTISWMHTILGLNDFNLSQCLFGEHLITSKHDPVIVVESEKSAIIGSIVIPDYVWVATGGKSSGVADKLMALKNYKVTLVPDIDATESWKKLIEENTDLQGMVLNEYLFYVATEEQRKNQYDIADFLLDERASRSNKTKLP
jgi:hypothetical protein